MIARALLALALAAALVPGARAMESHGPGHGPGAVEADMAHDAHAAAHDGAEHGEHHGMPYVPMFFNFILFAAGLTYVLHKPVRSFFRERRASIAASFAAAEQARRESEARLAELESKLASLDAQVQEILARAHEQAAAEREIILEQAKTDAARILAQAEAQVSDLEGESVRRLKATAADLSIQVARGIIDAQLQPADRNRFFDRTLKGLQKAAGST